MRVFYDEYSESIVVDGTKRLYAPRSLSLTVDGEDVSIWQRGDIRRIVGPISWTAIRDEAGHAFADSATAIAHLNEVFSRTPDEETNYQLAFEGSLT